MTSDQRTLNYVD